MSIIFENSIIEDGVIDCENKGDKYEGGKWECVAFEVFRVAARVCEKRHGENCNLPSRKFSGMWCLAREKEVLAAQVDR